MSVRHELRVISTMAWPVVLGQLAQMSMQVVDTLLLGRVGADAMASVSLGGMWSFAVCVFGYGMMRGLDPLLSQAHGARDQATIGRTFGHGLGLAAALSVVSIALVWPAERGLALLGQPADLLPTAGTYARIFCAAIPSMFFFHLIRGVLQAQEQMRPATIAVVVANVVHAAAGYAFVFGHFGAPKLGAVGAAVATVGSSWFQLFVLVALTHKELARGWQGLGAAREVGPILALARTGFPQALQVGSEVWGFLVAGFIVGSLGAVSLAGHTVTMQLASVSFMVPLGVSAAAATRVGNHIGAGTPWKNTAIAAHILGLGVMSVSASLFALAPGWLASLFTPDVAVVALAATLIPVAAAFQLFDGTQVVAFGVLRGAGDQVVPSIANLIGYWLVGLPLGAWLALRGGMGVHGLWIGLVVALALVAALLLVRERWTLSRGGFRVVS